MMQTRFLTLCAGLVVGLVIVGAPQWIVGQEAKPPAKPEAKAEGAKKAPAKPRGYLPPHYNEVVTKEQREKIYAIQDSYDDKIAALQAQLKELLGKRDAEVKAVLSPEQQKRVEEYANLAKAKAKDAKDAKEAKAAATTTKTPAETPKKP